MFSVDLILVSIFVESFYLSFVCMRVMDHIFCAKRMVTKRYNEPKGRVFRGRRERYTKPLGRVVEYGGWFSGGL